MPFCRTLAAEDVLLGNPIFGYLRSNIGNDGLQFLSTQCLSFGLECIDLSLYLGITPLFACHCAVLLK
ncbi:hypothetical protein WT31_09720 [Burkholderia territorii]|nr:hypothetical protein WT31_09720 [Burkholderia territorii]